MSKVRRLRLSGMRNRLSNNRHLLPFAAAEHDANDHPFPFPDDLHFELISRSFRFDVAEEIVRGFDFLVIDADDHIGGLGLDLFEDERPALVADQFRSPQPGPFGRPVRRQTDNAHAVVGLKDALDPDFRTNDPAMRDQLLYDAGDEIDGNRETNAGTLPIFTSDGGVDADQLAVGVNKRTSGVAGIHGGIDLDDGTGDAPPTPQPGTHSDAGLERPMGKPRHFFGDAAAPPPQPVKAPGAPSLSGPRKQPTGRSSPSPAKEAQKPTGRTKRAPVAALTPMELVEQLILKSRKGIDTATLVKKTGLSAPQIRSIVQRLRMQGRIATLARGIYGKAPI